MTLKNFQQKTFQQKMFEKKKFEEFTLFEKNICSTKCFSKCSTTIIFDKNAIQKCSTKNFQQKTLQQKMFDKY